MNLELYRYFIGREDQSVNEANMIKRVDQQLRVTRIMMNAVDVYALPPEQAKLRAYMLNYFSMMMAISSIFLTLDGSKEALAKRRQLWDDLKAHDGHLYRRCRFSAGQQDQHRRLPHRPEDLQVQLRYTHAGLYNHLV